MKNDEFFDSYASIRRVILADALVDQGLGQTPHNVSARILRHGVAVTVFALLEAYIEGRVREFFASASSWTVGYSDMSDKFRQFVTISGAQGLLNRITKAKKVDRIGLYETNALSLAQFLATPATYTWHGFRPSGSNVSDDDISTCFAALGLDQPWLKLTALTSTLGAARPDLKIDFQNLASRRNSSAHDPRTNVATADLVQVLEAASIIAITIALKLSALRRVYESAKDAAQLSKGARNPTEFMRFVDERPDGWVERNSPQGRVLKVSPNVDTAIAAARARKGAPDVVVRNQRGLPVRVA